MKIAKNLSGIDALQLLQKGHMVRRSCWIPGFLIRVCNETGFDEDGNILSPGNSTPIYTHATSGYFMHVGFSSQPFNFPHHLRDGEGLFLFFENDWEDHGFISAKDFDLLTENTKETVKKLEHKQQINSGR